MFRGDDASKILAPGCSMKDDKGQESLEEYKKRKGEKLSEEQRIREDLIELNYEALNKDKSFVDLVVKYIMKKASVAQ